MKNRYPGIHAFTADDSPIFYGRSREIKELFRLAVLNNVVVLFGKSGTGKTSLLQAGVAPLLNERFLQPVKLRLNNTHQPIARQLFEQFEEGEYLPMHTPDTLSLWEYCKQFDYSENGESFTPLLILDQFEELFTLYTDNIEAQQQFIKELADVVNGKTPEYLQSQIRAANPTLAEEELQRRLNPPKVHIVISIRSDFLYLLDRLSEKIPAILRCRYELTALDEANARLAITQPAQMQGEFASPLFEFAEEAIQNILSTLTTTSQKEVENNHSAREIEAFQLQLLCSRIENKLITELAQNQKTKLAKAPVITSSFYGGTAGIAAMLSDFYNSVLAKIPENHRLQVQQLIEEKLISNERRIIQERDFIKKEYKLSDKDLKLLCKERLLREEPRGGTFYYEISHDTLVAPILESYKKRAAEEEKARVALEKEVAERKQKEAEAALAAERAQAEAEKLLRQKAEKASGRATIFAWGAGLLAIIAIAGLLFANSESKKAKAADAIAQIEKQNAVVKAKEAEKSDSIAQIEKQNAVVKAKQAQLSDSIAQIEKQNAVTKAKQAKDALNELVLTQRIAAAQKILTFAENYRNLGQNNYACANYKSVLDTLKKYPNDNLYLQTKEKIKQLCGN